MELSELFYNIGGATFCGFLVCLMNRVYTVLSEMKG